MGSVNIALTFESRDRLHPGFRFGEVAEWSKAAVLKTTVPKGTEGSNPSLSSGKLAESGRWRGVANPLKA